MTPGAGKGCAAGGSPRQPARPEGQRGTDGGPRPREAAQEPSGPGFSTRAPRTGPIRARRLARSPKSRPQRHHSEKKQRGTEASRGRGALRKGWNCLRDGGGARHPARKRRQGFSFKGAIRPSLPSPAGSCARTPAAPAAVRRPGRSALTLTSPRGPPGAAARRRPRRPSAGGGVAQPCPQAHGGGRRRFWPSSSPALRRAGPTPSPRALRPACEAPGPGSAATLTAALRACAARLRPAERAGR